MRIGLVAALLLFSQAGLAAQSSNPAGVYSTVSESEWEMELRLGTSHSAKLTISRWEPGNEKHPSVKTFSGKWRLVGDNVETTFKKGQLLFTVDPHLSFKELEKPGEAPGLVGVSGTLNGDNFAGLHFWLKSELAKIKW